MNYASMKVKDAMLQISENEICLSAFQRKSVWDTERIERLFDALMRGYYDLGEGYFVPSVEYSDGQVTKTI
jgi:hypothetical protein